MSNPDAGSPSNRATYCVPGEQCGNCPVRGLPELVPAIPGAISRIQNRPESIHHTDTVPVVAAMRALKEKKFEHPSRPQVRAVANAATMILFGKCRVEVAKEEHND